MLLYAKTLTACSTLGPLKGRLALFRLLLLVCLDLLLAGVGIDLGLALGLETLGLQALGLQLLLTLAALGRPDGVLLIQLLLEHLGEEEVSGYAENGVGYPVDTHGGRHDKADPHAHEGHHDGHALHGSLGLRSVLLGVGHVAYLHGRPGQESRHDRDEEQAQSGQPYADIAPVGVHEEVPLRLLAHIQAQEAEVDIHQAVYLPGQGGLYLVPVLVGNVRQLYLKVGVGLGGDGVPALSHKVVLQSGDHFLGYEHHAGQGLADNAVERYQDGEGYERPEAAGHGVDPLFPVQLLHLLVQLLGVALVAALQLLDLRREAGRAHHALLALGHERGHEQVDHEGKENDGHAVVAGKFIELYQRPGKYLANKFAHWLLLVQLKR